MKGLEILQQVSGLDAIVVPIGGGGMVRELLVLLMNSLFQISGIAIAAKGLNPHIKIYAAEPEGADDAFQSKQIGEMVGSKSNPPTSCADGLLASLGSITWPIVRDFVDEVFPVSEKEIKSAMRIVWERMKLVIEPSAAVGVAVVLSEQFKQKTSQQKRIAVVLCGGNVDLDTWKWN